MNNNPLNLLEVIMLRESLEHIINMEIIRTDYSPRRKPAPDEIIKQTAVIKTCYEIARQNKIELFSDRQEEDAVS